MSRYTVAILGCGPRGRDHAYGFTQNADRFELVAVCDQVPERLQAVAREFSVPRTYADGDEMLQAEQPDVFCFCTLPAIRLPIVEMGVRHGVKLIAYEKPMANSLGEARAMMQLCREHGVKTVVSHQMRYGAHFRKVKEIIDTGDIGELQELHAVSQGWLLQYATHLVHYVRFFNGGHEANWVIGQVHGRGLLGDSHPSPDYAMGLIEFRNGVRALIETGLLATDVPEEPAFWFKSKITARGTEGFAEVLVGKGWRAVTKSAGGLVSGAGCWSVENDQPPYCREIADWLDDPTKVHPCSGESAYHEFEIVMGFCRSALERRRIPLPLEAGDDNPIARLQEVLPGDALPLPA